ncbi:hypothetical protein B1T45_12925 [Mycobacterium kansasii]|nr:hypothetical protein B1T45_12925 [Mycobacterium kansasii]
MVIEGVDLAFSEVFLVALVESWAGGGELGGGVVPDLPVVPGVAVVGGGELGGEVVPDLPAAAAAAVEVRGSDGGALAFAASVTFPLSPAMEAAPSMILPAAAAAFI